MAYQRVRGDHGQHFLSGPKRDPVQHCGELHDLLSSGANIIGGTGPLTIFGGSTVKFSGPNTFSGGTTVSGGGTLLLASSTSGAITSGPVGTGTINLGASGNSSATLEFATGTTGLSAGNAISVASGDTGTVTIGTLGPGTGSTP